MRPCAGPDCGTEFEPRSSNQKYCSRRCSKRAENLAYRTRHSERAYCKGCGCGFQRARGQANKVYCSTSCQHETRAREYAEREDIRPPANDRILGSYYDQVKADPCAYCGSTGGIVDHIEPRSAGGENHWENYTGTCVACNSSKGRKPLLFFLGWRLAARDFDAWRSALGTTDADSRASSAAAAAR